MTLQGQAYWITDLYSFVYNHHFDYGVFDNLNYFSDHSKLGNKFIKNYFMDPVHLKNDSGSWAAVYPSILCINQTYLSFIFTSLFFNSIYFVIFNSIISQTTCRYFIYLSIPVSYFCSVVLKIFQSGNIFLLLHPKFIILFFLLLSYTLYKYIIRKTV